MYLILKWRPFWIFDIIQSLLTLNKIDVHGDYVWYKCNHVAKNHQNPSNNDVSIAIIVPKVKLLFLYFLLYIFGKYLLTTDSTFDIISVVKMSFLDRF